MVDFAKSARTAKRLIDKNGRLVTFIKNSRTLLDDSKPWGESKGSQITFDTIASFVDYEVNEIDGVKIKVGDKKLLVNAIDNGAHILTDFEYIQDGQIQWRIKNVNIIQPADIAVMFEVQVRK